MKQGENMAVKKEFNCFSIAELVEIIYVKNHKTFSTHGSAKCTLKEREALAIKAYVTKIRLVESKITFNIVILF